MSCGCDTPAGSVQQGNTVRLTALFYDWQDVPADPDSVTLTIYNRQWEQVTQLTAIREDVGVYYADWIAAEVGTHYGEWSGMLAALPCLYREPIVVRKV